MTTIDRLSEARARAFLYTHGTDAGDSIVLTFTKGALALAALLETVKTESAAEARAVPVPMYLTCPRCRARHVDEDEFLTRPHHTHACQTCGMTWRPAIGPTVGVVFLPGFKNAPTSETPVRAKPEGLPELDAIFMQARASLNAETQRLLDRLLIALDKERRSRACPDGFNAAAPLAVEAEARRATSSSAARAEARRDLDKVVEHTAEPGCGRIPMAQDKSAMAFVARVRAGGVSHNLADACGWIEALDATCENLYRDLVAVEEEHRSSETPGNTPLAGWTPVVVGDVEQPGAALPMQPSASEPGLDLDALEALHAATTPSWKMCRPCATNTRGCNLVWVPEVNTDTPLAGGDAVCATNADARFMAAAHERMPALIKELRAWRAGPRPETAAPEMIAALRKIGKCSRCNGDGEYLPTCFRCDDSTDDHECPGPRACTTCDQTGLTKDTRAALTALGAWPPSDAKVVVDGEVAKVAPCRTCGERDCGSAPRFAGMTSDARVVLREREAAERAGLAAAPIDWNAEANVALDRVRCDLDIEAGSGWAAAHGEVVTALQWAFNQGMAARPGGQKDPKNAVERMETEVPLKREAARPEGEKDPKNAVKHMETEAPPRREAALSLVERGRELLVVWSPRYEGWCLPGGMVELGEAVEGAQARELLEETGLRTRSARKVFTGEHGAEPPSAERGGRASLVHVFAVTTEEGEPHLCEGPVRWMTRERLLRVTPFREFYVRLFTALDAKAPVKHASRLAFRAICGSDVPNQHTVCVWTSAHPTADDPAQWAEVTCGACLALRSAERPLVADEGDEVEVLKTSYKGQRGKVVKVSPNGAVYRVRFDERFGPRDLELTFDEIRRLPRTPPQPDQPKYSGDASKAFWARVNALENAAHTRVYELACILQELEQRVLRALAECEEARK